MARRVASVEQTTFVKGLITEANPLTFPENASLDEKNFIIERDGTRRRRLGIDYEDSYSIISSEVSPSSVAPTVFSSYEWENVAGSADRRLSVCQVGNKIYFFDPQSLPLSTSTVGSLTLDIDTYSTVSFASVDGNLVIASGLKDITIVTYDSGTDTISSETSRLRVRDFFGLEDIVDGVDLTSAAGLSVRPLTYSDNHIYNLRNQSFGPSRSLWTAFAWSFFSIYRDPIVQYRDVDNDKFPSNSDAVFYNLYPNPELASEVVVERFAASHLRQNPPGVTPAPKGFFIIDALERGNSRLAEYANLLENNGGHQFPISSLNKDETPGGATVLGEYAGRVWYGGFPGEVVDGDSKSPVMSSYLLFSRLVRDPTDITKCYQEEDPTAKDSAGVLETDGGLLRISGAYGISNLIPLGDRLIILAENGVWSVRGGDAGFTATEYTLSKISDRGCSSPKSAIKVDGGIIYWGDDGIYLIAPNEFGDISAQNMSQDTIQSFFDDISSFDKKRAVSYYDTYDRKVRWLYSNRKDATDVPRELIYDVNLGAFYVAEFPLIGTDGPIPACHVQVPPFRIGEAVDEVVVDGTPVTVLTDPVQVTTDPIVEGRRETFYLTLVEDDILGRYQFTFSAYKDTDFVDWKTFDGTGVDAAAYLLTGYLTGGDTQRDKSVSYLIMHMLRTEDGIEELPDGSYTPTSPSSCKVQAQWNWTNSANSNRWGKEFQAYRYPRLYIPANLADPYDTGDLIITTKNKLRGSGKALSLLIKTEPAKDCRILGWGMTVMGEQNV